MNDWNGSRFFSLVSRADEVALLEHVCGSTRSLRRRALDPRRGRLAGPDHLPMPAAGAAAAGAAAAAWPRRAACRAPPSPSSPHAADAEREQGRRQRGRCVMKRTSHGYMPPLRRSLPPPGCRSSPRRRHPAFAIHDAAPLSSALLDARLRARPASPSLGIGPVGTAETRALARGFGEHRSRSAACGAAAEPAGRAWRRSLRPNQRRRARGAT